MEYLLMIYHLNIFKMIFVYNNVLVIMHNQKVKITKHVTNLVNIIQINKVTNIVIQFVMILIHINILHQETENNVYKIVLQQY